MPLLKLLKLGFWGAVGAVWVVSMTFALSVLFGLGWW